MEKRRRADNLKWVPKTLTAKTQHIHTLTMCQGMNPVTQHRCCLAAAWSPFVYWRALVLHRLNLHTSFPHFFLTQWQSGTLRASLTSQGPRRRCESAHCERRSRWLHSLQVANEHISSTSHQFIFIARIANLLLAQLEFVLSSVFPVVTWRPHSFLPRVPNFPRSTVSLPSIER